MMMKLKSYDNYGDGYEHVKFVFENKGGYKITFYSKDNDYGLVFESETITFKEFEEAKEMFEATLKTVKVLEEK